MELLDNDMPPASETRAELQVCTSHAQVIKFSRWFTKNHILSKSIFIFYVKKHLDTKSISFRIHYIYLFLEFIEKMYSLQKRYWPNTSKHIVVALPFSCF